MENRKKVKVIIEAVTPIKSGVSSKNGRRFKWHLSEVTARNIETGKSAKFSTFSDFAGREGEEFEVEIWLEKNEKNGKVYENWKMALPKRNVWDAIKDLEERVLALEEAESEREAKKVGDEINIF